MNHVDIEKIYSNEFADFIINYNGDPTVLEQYKNNVNIINYFNAVVHLPVSEMTENIISRIGYAPIPNLFGFASQASQELSGIPRLRMIPKFDLRGKGVLIGFIDSGIDYTNPIFQNADKTTKIASIWDQTIISDQIPVGMAYGTEYSRNQINEALKIENPYSMVPTKDEIGHGTMIAGIAAGNEVEESGFYGVATEADLVVVKLKSAKPYLKEFFRVPENAVCYQENDVIFGIEYLIDYAIRVNQPIVLCIAIDTAQLAHDGRGKTSSWLSIQASNVGIAALIAVGNEGNAQRHYLGTIDDVSGYYKSVELNVGPNESGFSMELWGNTPNIFSIDIISPSGEYIPNMSIPLNETTQISFVFEPTVIYIDHQNIETQSGDQLILLRFTKPSMGIWKFKVYSKGIYPINFNIWLPMDDCITEDTFFIQSEPNITLLSLSCSSIPISVTAYNTDDESSYIKAGRGFTRINLVKPDIAAPGVKIVAPTLDHGFAEVTGTSAAVSHTAGVAAMLLEWGIVKGNYPDMSTEDMKIFMIRGARRKNDLKYPNPQWGYGILDVFNIFDIIRSKQ